MPITDTCSDGACCGTDITPTQPACTCHHADWHKSDCCVCVVACAPLAPQHRPPLIEHRLAATQPAQQPPRGADLPDPLTTAGESLGSTPGAGRPQRRVAGCWPPPHSCAPPHSSARALHGAQGACGEGALLAWTSADKAANPPPLAPLPCGQPAATSRRQGTWW